MEQIETYIFLLSVIVIVGQLFRKSTIPVALIFVISGIILSFLPFIPEINLNPEIALDFFLPLLIYQISAFSSWRDVKKNLRPIALLSVGHVIFITVAVAIVIHALIPQLGWPLAFILGAIISPPDDVAIVSIAENIRIPERIFTILEGEAMFNDAAALTLFRFGLAALITHEFSAIHALTTFFAVIIGETFYGLLLGNIIGRVRKKIQNPIIHIIASIITPFLAYIPMVKLGGSGVIATAITGFIIGNQFSIRFTPEFRLVSRAVWPALAFTLQGLLFLLVGFNMRSLFEHISSLRFETLALYATAVIAAVIIGRFIWQYIFVGFLPRFLFPAIRKKDPYPRWQDLFIISWAGMRGGISLAAALSIPFLPVMVDGVNPRDLIIFLVCCVIIATLLLQGLTLPWLLKRMGAHTTGEREKFGEHVAELSARLKMAKGALRWLKEYNLEIKKDLELQEEVKLHIRQYKIIIRKLKTSISEHNLDSSNHDEDAELRNDICLLKQIVDAERSELLKLWRMEKITLTTRNMLMSRLDHRIQHVTST